VLHTLVMFLNKNRWYWIK